MKPTPRDHEDFAHLAETARVATEKKLPHFLHLDQAVGIWNYIRIANEIADRNTPGRLLDWGCGFGQMTHLLRRRGFTVTPFDVGAADAPLPDVPLTRGLQVMRSTHPTDLPFPAGAFDAVLSCGVLEHVDEFSEPGNEVRSLGEIRRVLTSRGVLLIYQLPQRYSSQEAISRTLRLGYAHPRRFTAGEIRSLLARTGYRVVRLRRNNMLPKNLTGLPAPIRAFYSRFSLALIRLDDALSVIPGLNQLAGVMEIVARPA